MGSVWCKLDEETGELINYGRGRFISEEQDEAIRKKRAKSAGEEEQGDFIWSLFKYCKELFPDLNCPSITRLFYLATFVEYNGNRLIDNKTGEFFTKRQVKRKLMLTDSVFTSFWNDMINNKIISVDDNGLVILNTALFKKGKIDKRCKKDFIRVYCDCVRLIYESTSNMRDHAKLAYIFKIIPYVNRKNNIVCFNPEELDDNKVQPMSFGEMCEVIGYDRVNASRLFKDLLKFTVNGRHLLCYVSLKNYTITGAFVIINPNIYYGGAEQSNTKFLFDICDRKMEDSK